MEAPSDDPTREPRRKEKAKKKTSKDDKAKKDRKLSRVKKQKLSTLVEGEGVAMRSLIEADAAENDENIERGLTQELILQLRALDLDDDDAYGGASAGSSMMSSFFGHTEIGAEGGEASTTVYVENEVSGEFFRVRQRYPGKSNGLERSRTSLRRFGDEDERVQLHCDSFSWSSLRDIDAALSILGHGIVVGLSWMDAFNWGATRDRFLRGEATRMRFVCTYSGVADRTRQLFFLLFNLTLLGLMRKISRLRAQRQIANEDQRLERFRVHSLRLLQGAFACTSIALLVLLISSASTLRLATSFAQDPNWCEHWTSDSAALSALYRHQESAIANAVFLSLGWLLVCIQCNMGMASHLSLRRRLVEAHNGIDKLEMRNNHLRGETLDGLSIDALKDLIQQHHRAIEVTESVLVTKLQMQNPLAGRGT